MNNIDFFNILFWSSFVGFIIFLVRGMYSSVLLKVHKENDFSQADFATTTISAVMAVLFAVVAMSVYNNPSNTNNSAPTQNNTYEEIGKIIIYNQETNQPDTLEIFKEIKE